MKKWQLPVTIVSLLALLLGMNYVVDWQRQNAEAMTEKVKKGREAAEAQAMAAKGEHSAHGDEQEEVFKLPESTGPAQAPVKVEVFVNNAKSCQTIDPELQRMQAVYGSLLRVEWLSMTEAKVADRTDKLRLGCEAGLAVNGKIEVEVEKNGGKSLVTFRGPVGQDYRLDDVYRAINLELKKKGKPVPKAAAARVT